MRVYIDSSVAIYVVEGHGKLQTSTAAILDHYRNSDSSLFCSKLLRLECMVKPIRSKDHVLLDRYGKWFRHSQIEMYDIDDPVLDEATRIRAQYSFKTPDAIHLATACVQQANLFLTGDYQLLRFKELQVVEVSNA